MKWSYSELLIVLSVLVVAVVMTWSIVYHFAPQYPQSRIYETTDGPEMQKVTKMIMDQVEKERR